MKALQAMAEHGPVRLPQNSRPDFDLQIRANAEKVSVEDGVMELAQSQAVRHDGLAARVSIGKDVGGFE